MSAVKISLNLFWEDSRFQKNNFHRSFAGRELFFSQQKQPGVESCKQY